jgi:soluble lytic murein transglycosylase-like protein
MAEWKNINVHQGSSSYAGQASNALSNAGDIFTRLAEQSDANRYSRLRANLEASKLDENARQFDLGRIDNDRAFNESVRQFNVSEANDQTNARMNLLQNVSNARGEFNPETLDEMNFPGRNRSTNSTSTQYSPSEYDGFIKSNSERYQVPEQLIRSVMQLESSGNPNAKSPTGVQGLMQVTRATTREMGYDPDDRTNPDNSIGAGTKYLSQLFNKYGNWEDSLIAYNGGHGAVQYAKTGQANPDWISALQKAGVTDIQGKLNEVNKYAENARRISMELEANGIPTQRGQESPVTNNYTTPNSLGLTNQYADRMAQIESRGGFVTKDVREQADKRNAEIAEAQSKQDRVDWSNNTADRLIEEAGGDVISARDAYRVAEKRDYGDNQPTTPLDGLVEVRERDIALQKAVEAGDREAIGKARSALSSGYKDFIKNQVEEDSQFSMDNNITRAAQNLMFGGKPEDEEVMKGIIAREIYKANTGDKDGVFFDGRNSKFQTTLGGINDQNAETLAAIANMDYNTVTLDDMNPLMTAIYNEAVKYGIVPKEMQDGVQSRSSARTAINKVESDRKKSIQDEKNLNSNINKRFNRLVSTDNQVARIGGHKPVTIISERDKDLFKVDTNDRFNELEVTANKIRGNNKNMSQTESVMSAMKEMRAKYATTQ